MLPRLTFALCLLTLVACSQSPPTLGADQPFASACDRANDGERIAVQGYLRLPDSFTGNQNVILRLYETDAFGGTPIGVSLWFGPEANQMDQVPDSYGDDDLHVHLADGQVVGYGTKVKVSGKVYYPIVDQDFVCGLENPLVESAS